MNPSIDVVIIGLNSARTLADCIRSVRSSHYPQEKIELYYADGGSSDGSREIAASLGAHCLLVEADSPTPGRQRNAGWKAGKGDLVQFLDSDTILDPQWLSLASRALGSGVVAACGDRRERFPDRSVFNWIGDQEWNPRPGEVDAFGGDVLVERATLVATNGYNPDLIGGEDPELSFRIRQSGGRILKLVAPMTLHDLAMFRLRQYWKRGYRTGHAYAEVNAMHPSFWKAQSRRIVVKGVALGVALLSLPVSLLTPWVLLVSLFGFLFFFRPRLQLVKRFQKQLECSRVQARIYAWHATLVVVPQFFGMIRYLVGKLFSRPLTNNTVLRRTRGSNAL